VIKTFISTITRRKDVLSSYGANDMITTTHIEIIPEDESIDPYEVEVDWDFTPEVPAKLFGLPEDCYPAEGGELNQCIVALPDGTIIEGGEEWLRNVLGNKGYDWAEDAAYTSEMDEY
jgi:hypothetical protein